MKLILYPALFNCIKKFTQIHKIDTVDILVIDSAFVLWTRLCVEWLTTSVWYNEGFIRCITVVPEDVVRLQAHATSLFWFSLMAKEIP
jgi:hypothetical protein